MPAQMGGSRMEEHFFRRAPEEKKLAKWLGVR